jgi:uncharacterized membrane protein YkgB
MARLTAWAKPRTRAIIIGTGIPVAALLLFGTVTNDWSSVVAGFVGIVATLGLAIFFVVNPEMWEPQRRWRVLLVFIGAGTLLVVIAVILVFLLT